MVESEDLKLIKKEYAAIKKKYKLPDFNKIDREFEIRKCTSEGFIMREVRRTILSKLQDYMHLLDPALNPHPGSLHSMIESDGFTEEERKKLYELYKKLGFLIHEGLLASFNSEKSEAEFINTCWKKWPTLKKDMKRFLAKTTKLWNSHQPLPDDAEYMS